nr:hypothetical protein [uncultured Shimia sp.]
MNLIEKRFGTLDFTPLRTATAAVAAMAFSGAAIAQETSQTVASPLEKHADRQFNFETANQLQRGGLKLWVGSHQTVPGQQNSGTAEQYYWGGGEWGVSDRVQLGFAYNVFNDPVSKPVLGASARLRMETTSFHGKYKVLDTAQWGVAAQASVEQLLFRFAPYGGAVDDTHTIGSLHLPITYKASDALQLHVTPGVSVLPSTINGNAFFGTVASVGAGFSWKPSLRWLTYGSVNMPVSGGNTISNTLAIEKTPIWTVGARYNVTPLAALDLFATNGGGVSPATGILSTVPDGDTVMIGGMITYTPGRRAGYRPNYRGTSAEPLNTRQKNLQLDGFTLASADTLGPGRFAFLASAGSGDSYAGSLKFSPDYDLEIEVAYEQHSIDGSVGRPSIPSNDPNYSIGGKMRFLDQNNGSPFSLALHMLAGRDTNASGNGTFYLGMPMTYKANSRMALNLNPKGAIWGNTERFGLGFGVNYAVTPELDAIGEITPVSGGEDVVWAAGLRYHVRGSGLSVDLHASNAIGRHALKSMIGQDDVKITLGATMAFDWLRR